MEALVEGLDVNLPQKSDSAMVFAYGQDPNPRKVKRTINVFLLLWTLSLRREGLRGSIQPIRLAKIVVLQHSYRALFKILLLLPERLGELEAHFRQQKTLSVATESPKDEQDGGDQTPSLPENLKPFASMERLKSLLTLHPWDNEEANFAIWENGKYNPIAEEQIKAYIELTHSITHDQRNLTGTDLRSTNLRGANLNNEGLVRANMSGADLLGAYLAGADLSYANLRNARVSYANLRVADLSSADLSSADLSGANFRQTNLEKANIKRADLRETLDLTQEQIDRASGDENTLLPLHLQRPSGWTAVSPDDPETWYERGEALYYLGRYEDALGAYEEALSTRPEYSEALRGKGGSLFVLGRYEQAFAEFDHAVELDPENAILIARRGETLQALGRYEEALTDFDRAVELEPENAFAVVNRAETYRALGRYEEALADFDHAIELNPDYAFAILGRGETLQALGRYEEALASLDRVLELDPENAILIVKRAETYRALGRYEEALADFDRAIELEPENTFVIVKQGEIYQTLDRYEKAEQLYQRALEIQERVLGPKHPDTVHTREALEVVKTSKGKRVHTVQPGDTFYTLAEKYYGDENKYEVIAKANPEAQATRLSPGQMLRIP